MQVILEVEVEAFDKDDAEIVVSDYLGPGPMDDVLKVIKTSIKHK